MTHFGTNYWAKINDQEFESKWHQICLVEERVHSMTELNQFMVKLQGEDLVQEGLPLYRFVLVPNFKEDQSVMIYLANHAQGDGLAVSSLFLALSNNFDPANLCGVKKFPPMTTILLQLLSPIITLVYLFKLLLGSKKDQNSICEG